MQIAVGKHANDFGSHLDGDDMIGALRSQSTIAQDFIQDIVKENTQGLEVVVSEAQQSYGFTNLYVFTGVFAGCSLLLTMLQYKVIRGHLKARKYI